MKELGSLDTIVEFFRQQLESLPDKRTGKNSRYGMEDAALSAFSVFFTQSPSFLAYQRTMEQTKGRSNAQSLFGVHKIPSDNHIRDLLDPVKPKELFPVFETILQAIEEKDISPFFWPNGTMPNSAEYNDLVADNFPPFISLGIEE